MKTIAVFCGSSPGKKVEYSDAVIQLAKELVNREIRVIYGGASVGTMGVLADAVLQHGGEVVGVLPKQLFEIEIDHKGLTELHVVESMHQRKALMAELSDGFIALPGGLGTLEEFAEIVTWAQLGLHSKPTGLLNVLGFYNSLIEFFDHAVEEMFLRPQNRSLVLSHNNAPDLLDAMQSYKPIVHSKWMDANGTELQLKT